jgi:hypothetical protein
LAIPRAGTAPRFRLSGLPFRKGALNERGDLVRNRKWDECREIVTVIVASAWTAAPVDQPVITA